VISLKRHMELNAQELFDSALHAYRAALGAMGACGAQACPPIGPDLALSLENLQSRLAAVATVATLSETEQLVRRKLTDWGAEAGEYFMKKTADVKEVLRLVARTAEAVGERDARYTHEFGALSAKLNSIAELDNLAEMRQSLTQSVVALSGCVSRMAKDGQASVSQLRAELSAYQSKLEEAELQASRDALTGLDNRRKVELQMELLSRRVQTFCVILLDLDGFKEINDRYGHLAGDEVLKQFAKELRGAFRATDTVGRWGGDEFMVVIDCGLKEAEGKINALRRWTLGDYRIQTPSGVVKVSVNASLGLATWSAGEAIANVVARADAAMYADKAATERAAPIRALGSRLSAS
jgi:diguanylate cyclase (GGDEF)-like protein